MDFVRARPSGLDGDREDLEGLGRRSFPRHEGLHAHGGDLPQIAPKGDVLLELVPVHGPHVDDRPPARAYILAVRHRGGAEG